MMNVPRSLMTAVTLGLAGVSTTAAWAVGREASNITPADTRSLVAPALPVPPVSSAAPPRTFLIAARAAVEVGRTGEAQEALERAATGLLNEEGAGFLPNARQGRALGFTRQALQALATQDRSGAIRAIDQALDAGVVIAQAPPPPPPVAVTPSGVTPPPILPVPSTAAPAASSVTTALLPGRWQLHGAKYEWVPPDRKPRPVAALAAVPGRYVWDGAAYVWVPANLAGAGTPGRAE